jgi:hypothetical protein
MRGSLWKTFEYTGLLDRLLADSDMISLIIPDDTKNSAPTCGIRAEMGVSVKILGPPIDYI